MSDFFGKLYQRQAKQRSQTRMRARDEKYGIGGAQNDGVSAEESMAEAKLARQAEIERERKAEAERESEAHARGEEERLFRERAEARARAEAEARARAEAEARARAEAEARARAEAEAEAEAMRREKYFAQVTNDLPKIGLAVRRDMSGDRSIEFKDWNATKSLVGSAESALKARDYDGLQKFMSPLYENAWIRDRVGVNDALAKERAEAEKPLTAETVVGMTFRYDVPGGHRSGEPLAAVNTPARLVPRGNIIFTNPGIARPDGSPPNASDEFVIGNLAWDGNRWTATVLQVVEKTPRKLSDRIDLRAVKLERRGGRITEHRAWATTQAILRRHAGNVETSGLSREGSAWVYRVNVDPTDQDYDRSGGMGVDNIAFEFDENSNTIFVFHSGRSS